METELRVARAPVTEIVTSSGKSFTFSPQLSSHFEKETEIMWSRWTATPRPCFNLSLLADLHTYSDFLTQSRGFMHCDGKIAQIKYIVLASGMPGVFNFGGDLDLFIRLISRRDRTGLLNYGRDCIKVLYRHYVSYGITAATLSLVQGQCLGGGFEAALASDVIIAERSSRFSFPEIHFNLFPGMGAYSLLHRKVGPRLAREIIAGGKVYSAEDMLALGVVDAIAGDGEGEMEVRRFIQEQAHRRNGLQALAAARQRVYLITLKELFDVVHIWADAALQLDLRDISLMNRFVRRQDRLNGRMV